MAHSDIDPMNIDPATNRPYSNYSSPALDTSFHDGEMDVDDHEHTDECARLANEDDEDDDDFWSDDPRAMQGMGR